MQPRIVILGGGTGGTLTANRLRRLSPACARRRFFAQASAGGRHPLKIGKCLTLHVASASRCWRRWSRPPIALVEGTRRSPQGVSFVPL